MFSPVGFSHNSIVISAQYTGHLLSNIFKATRSGTTVVSWPEYRYNLGFLENERAAIIETGNLTLSLGIHVYRWGTFEKSVYIKWPQFGIIRGCTPVLCLQDPPMPSYMAHNPGLDLNVRHSAKMDKNYKWRTVFKKYPSKDRWKSPGPCLTTTSVSNII